MVCPPDSSILFPCSFCHDTTLQHYLRYSTTVPKALRQTLRVSSSERRTDVPKFTLYCNKRCMLVSLKLAADFSRGCTLQRIGRSFLATRPTASRCATCSVPALQQVEHGSLHPSLIVCTPLMMVALFSNGLVGTLKYVWER
jgi:hypothetical protein